MGSATAGADDDDDDGDDDDDDDGQAGDRCTESAHADDLSLDFDDHASTPGTAFHVAAVGELAVVCGEGFAAVWDPGAQALSGTLTLSGTCQGAAPVGDGQVALATAGTIVIADVSSSGLSESASASASGVTGVASDGTSIFAAGGDQGVLAFALSSGSLASDGTMGSVADARDVAWTDAGLVVAAGDAGVMLLDGTGNSIATTATDSPALRVRAQGDRVAILRGAYGWDLASADASGISLDATVDTGGVVLDAAFIDDGVLTAEAYGIVRHDDAGEFVSVEHAEGLGDPEAAWLRGVAVLGGDAVAVDDAGAVPLAVRDATTAPELTVDVPSLSVWSPDGGPAEALYLFKNTGTAPMLVRDATADGPFGVTIDTAALEESSDCPGQHIVEPGGAFGVTVDYDGGSSFESGMLTIETDDPDQRELSLLLEANRGAPAVGDPAPGFSLPTLDGDQVALSDHAGKVVFIKLFNFGCATCAEEFPVIQDDLLPAYSADDLLVLGINTTHRTAYAAELAEGAGVTFPMALDLDSSLFRQMRVPGKVFPLHIVIGRDGNYTYVSNEAGIEGVQAAIDAAL